MESVEEIEMSLSEGRQSNSASIILEDQNENEEYLAPPPVPPQKEKEACLSPPPVPPQKEKEACLPPPPVPPPLPPLNFVDNNQDCEDGEGVVLQPEDNGELDDDECQSTTGSHQQSEVESASKSSSRSSSLTRRSPSTSSSRNESSLSRFHSSSRTLSRSACPSSCSCSCSSRYSSSHRTSSSLSRHSRSQSSSSRASSSSMRTHSRASTTKTWEKNSQQGTMTSSAAGFHQMDGSPLKFRYKWQTGVGNLQPIRGGFQHRRAGLMWANKTVTHLPYRPCRVAELVRKEGEKEIEKRIYRKEDKTIGDTLSEREKTEMVDLARPNGMPKLSEKFNRKHFWRWIRGRQDAFRDQLYPKYVKGYSPKAKNPPLFLESLYSLEASRMNAHLMNVLLELLANEFGRGKEIRTLSCSIVERWLEAECATQFELELQRDCKSKQFFGAIRCLKSPRPRIMLVPAELAVGITKRWAVFIVDLVGWECTLVDCGAGAKGGQGWENSIAKGEAKAMAKKIGKLLSVLGRAHSWQPPSTRSLKIEKKRRRMCAEPSKDAEVMVIMGVRRELEGLDGKEGDYGDNHVSFLRRRYFEQIVEKAL